MYKKKLPVCKLCGKVGHFKYQCYKNPKRGKALKKRYEQAYKTGKTPKHDKLLSSQTLDRKRLIMELDKYCSLIVRISESDKYGVAECYSCKKRLPWKFLQNGHLKSRQFQGTRWDFDNMRPQCLTKGHKVGKKDISEIMVGDVIPSMFGQTSVVATKTFKSPIVEVEYEGGKIKSSPEHRMLVEKKGEQTWMSAYEIYDDLKKGEELFIIGA